jgi:hypothetical protein
MQFVGWTWRADDGRETLREKLAWPDPIIRFGYKPIKNNQIDAVQQRDSALWSDLRKKS